MILENDGYCPICEQNVTFRAELAWLRDHYLCSNCGSIPRERALMRVLQLLYPNWRSLTIHESSPVWRGVSLRLRNECPNYIESQFFSETGTGQLGPNGVRCENLESLSFPDFSIDLHITQDVMEHVFFPDRAFREISRTLSRGGAHIFTVPLVNKAEPSRRRARLACDGTVEHLISPIYHGNPVSADGSLVTIDWGFDIARYIDHSCGLPTQTYYFDDLGMGLRAEYIEVLVTTKLDPPVID